MDASPYSGGVLLPVRIVSLLKTPFTLYEPEMMEAVQFPVELGSLNRVCVFSRFGTS
jgi:hypothetical protein